MASFNIAYNISRRNEGGYANNTATDNIPGVDTGGETYAGVSYVSNPTWEGWKLVRAYIKANGGKIKTNTIIPDPRLAQLVKDLFKTKYWDKFSGDKIQSQTVANIMFDFAITSGVSKSAMNAQSAAGVKTDGIIRNDSLRAINKENEKDLAAKILKRNLAYYSSLAKKDPEKYGWAFKSWKSRIDYFSNIVDKIPGGAAGGAGMLIGLIGTALFFLIKSSKRK